MYVVDDTARTTSLSNNQISASQLLATLAKASIRKPIRVLNIDFEKFSELKIAWASSKSNFSHG